jgi:hypothetical protein
MILRLGPAAARGSIAHRWFEAVAWLDDGTPSDDMLRTLAAEVQATLDDAQLDALIADFRGWVAAPEVARLLGRRNWPRGAEVEREVPFITRTGDVMVEGFIDRLVLTARVDEHVRPRRGRRCSRHRLQDRRALVSAGAHPAASLLFLLQQRPVAAHYRYVSAGRCLPPRGVRHVRHRSH